MSKSSAIRWTRNQIKRLRDAVSAYNATITRAVKNGYPIPDILPQKTSVAAERERIQTAADLNRVVSSLRRILKSNNPNALNVRDLGKGNFVTEYTYREANIDRAIVNRERLRRIKAVGGEMKKDKRGIWVPVNTKTRYIIDQSSLMPIVKPIKTAEQAKTFRRAAENARRGNIGQTYSYYNNYKTGVQHYFSQMYPTQTAYIVSMLDRIMTLPQKKIQEIFDSKDYYGTFEYMYPGVDRTPIDRKIQKMVDYWQDLESELIEANLIDVDRGL